jgi:molecular chaperone HtpG
MALHMQRLLREAGHEVPGSEPVLEINPAHPLVRALDAATDASRVADLGQLLFEEAQLTAGDQLADPAAFIARLNRLLVDRGA